jgi:hypothetical protein
MSLIDLAALATGLVTGLAGVAALVNFLVKHYLVELKPNSGSSLRDSVDRTEEKLSRLEVRVDTIIEMLGK